MHLSPHPLPFLLFFVCLFIYLFIYSFLSFPLQKVEELNTTLSELEDLRTVSEELEESQAQAMKDLRSELSMFFSFSYSFSCPYPPLLPLPVPRNIYLIQKKIDKREMTLLNREGDLANWQLKCSDQEKTVNQFRDLVTKLQVFLKSLSYYCFALLFYCLFVSLIFVLLAYMKNNNKNTHYDHSATLQR